MRIRRDVERIIFIVIGFRNKKIHNLCKISKRSKKKWLI